MKWFSNILFFGLFLSFSGVFYACKKDVPPKLKLTVVDTAGNKLEGADVRVWYGADAQSGIPNQQDYDQRKTTTANGEVVFEFTNSAILDVVVFAPIVVENPPFPDHYDTLVGNDVIKVEMKQQRSRENLKEASIECY